MGMYLLYDCGICIFSMLVQEETLDILSRVDSRIKSVATQVLARD